MQKWKRPIFKSRVLIFCVKDKTQILTQSDLNVFNFEWN